MFFSPPRRRSPHTSHNPDVVMATARGVRGRLGLFAIGRFWLLFGPNPHCDWLDLLSLSQTATRLVGSYTRVPPRRISGCSSHTGQKKASGGGGGGLTM